MTEELIPYIPEGKTRTKWSQREDAIIYSKIDQSPQNLRSAFEQAALELPQRTVDSVSKHWYKSLKSKDKAVVIVASKGTAIQKNVKNTPRQITLSTGEIRLQDVMKDVVNMSRNQRDILRRYLMATES